MHIPSIFPSFFLITLNGMFKSPQHWLNASPTKVNGSRVRPMLSVFENPTQDCCFDFVLTWPSWRICIDVKIN